MTPGPVQHDQSEIGRELFARDLASLFAPKRWKVVVATQMEGTPYLITAWLTGVEEKMVWLFMGKAHLTLGLYIQPDGSLRDGPGRQIHIFEYLGEV